MSGTFTKICQQIPNSVNICHSRHQIFLHEEISMFYRFSLHQFAIKSLLWRTRYADQLQTQKALYSYHYNNSYANAPRTFPTLLYFVPVKPSILSLFSFTVLAVYEASRRKHVQYIHTLHVTKSHLVTRQSSNAYRWHLLKLNHFSLSRDSQSREGWSQRGRTRRL